MKPDTGTRYMGFEAVKKNLDPAYDYLVFQFPTSSSRASVAQDISNVLANLVDSPLESQLCLDRERDAWLLVIRIDPAEWTETEEQLLAARLPARVIYYRFKKPARNQRR